MLRFQKIRLLSVWICLFPLMLGAQHVGEYEGLIHKDTSLHSFLDFFEKGHIHGHVRNYFMATVNQGDLRDYWTNATGGALKFETAEWYGFQLGVKGIFTYQTLSSDLGQIDSISGKSARWEKQLYDINRPDETNDLDRLEELYLKFNFSKSFLEIGKIDINEGPLFLRRDGRMKPFVYRGIWSEFLEFDKQKISLGMINGVSPRGMTEWFSLNEAIGLLNNGRQPDGSPAHYLDKTRLDFILLGGYEYEKAKGIKFQFWNYHFHHLQNIAWFQTDVHVKHLIAGIQYVNHRALGSPFEVAYGERYIQDGEQSQVINLLLGYQNLPKNLAVSGTYYYSTRGGRFLFPKELGRENFYISDARSWMEGMGGVRAYMLDIKYAPAFAKQDRLLFRLRLSDVNTPSENYLNKYGTPSYRQISLDSRIKFPKSLKGLSLRLLYVSRTFKNDHLFSLADKFYKSNYHHFNLITNVDF